jgi:pyruvate/2-oxoglutarate dehydrogenase complex dihydrolipoamide dehydrogenase (E3) component
VNNAAMFAALGSKVWLVDNYARIFPFVDSEIVTVLKEQFNQLITWLSQFIRVDGGENCVM